MNTKAHYSMKDKITYISVMLFLCLNCFSQSVQTPYEVATWYRFKSSAVSYTFDDGLPNQFNVAVPMFNKYGFKMTLFIITGKVIDWSKIKAAAADGHEIANHTVSHPNLSTLTVNQQRTELEVSSNSINANILSQNGLTLAYPYCVAGKDSMVSRLFIAARGCSGSIESKTPKNFLNISSIVCGNKESINSVAAFKTKADNVGASNGWLIYLIHAINDDNGYSPLAEEYLDGSLLYLKNNSNKFWVESFGNVARYIKERNCISIIEKNRIDTAITITVSDTLDNNIFNYPVSIRRSLPENWTSAKAFQNGKLITDTVITINTIKYIVFNAIPDRGDVLLIKDTAPVIGGFVNKTQMESPGNIKVWIQNKTLNYSSTTNMNTETTVSVFNLLGEKTGNFYSYIDSNGYGLVDISKSNITSGLYIVSINNLKTTLTKQLVLLK